ncbi:hypothetical protein JHN47_22375, partial [Streptomyces sp. MBT62]|nr:hypothetical protein [Streptomyces sp. MBT62]
RVHGTGTGRAGVHGGEVRGTATARAAGPGTVHAVVGLLLAGVAATAVALRSARRSRRPGRTD